MSIYKDLLFLHGYLRDLSVADDIEPARPRDHAACERLAADRPPSRRPPSSSASRDRACRPASLIQAAPLR